MNKYLQILMSDEVKKEKDDIEYKLSKYFTKLCKDNFNNIYKPGFNEPDKIVIECLRNNEFKIDFTRYFIDETDTHREYMTLEELEALE